VRLAQVIPDTPELRKARGAFFTPRAVTQYVADWAIRRREDAVLEPSCGEAEFLVSAGARLDKLGGPVNGAPQLHGVELHPESADAARGLLAARGYAAAVRTGDFFDAPFERRYDAVVGNPPYVRFQGFTGDARAKAQLSALSAGVRLSGLASSWAAFTVHSAELVTPDGRLGLVLPAELLTVNYAGPVRRYLMQRFASVRLVMFDERVFPGVMADVVLLLAEGQGPTHQIEVSQARNLSGMGDPPTIRWAPPNPEAKWTPALLPSVAAETYARLVREQSFAQLDDWGRTDLGMVSGNNKYFCLTSEDAAARKLGKRDLLRISPPGSRHLRGLSFETRAWKQLEAEGRRVYLFAPRRDDPSAAALQYIAEGEATGVQEAYKCRVRETWWHVPRVAAPDLLLTYMNYDAPRMVTNGAAVTYLNSVHGVKLRTEAKEVGRAILPLASLNSLSLLGAELVGRAYGGGLLKVEPREADLLPVPSFAVLAEASDSLRSLQPHLAKHLRGGDLDGAVSRVDRVLLIDHLGMRRAEVAELRVAREVLFARRRTRGDNVAD